MYHFRYYAIGHSYLLHGPFQGWQTVGEWGMAASEPEKDYFHRFRALLEESFDCKLEAVAENHATYERRCVLGVTAEDYKSSPEYAHMKEVLLTFKPNIISVCVGGGNTVANDAESLSFFYEVLYGMIAKYKRPDAIVVCPSIKKYIHEINKPIAEKYGFIAPDVSFIHEKKGYENPYYAFSDYPEYDAAVASGAVEFRTHPNDKGHDGIAHRMLDGIRELISERIAEGEFSEEYSFEQYLRPSVLPRLDISVEPDMYIRYNGFNLRREADGVCFGSAPETGASVSSNALGITPDYNKFYIEAAISSEKSDAKLMLSVSTRNDTFEYLADIPDGELRRYEFDLLEVKQAIRSFTVKPLLTECVITVRAVGFLK